MLLLKMQSDFCQRKNDTEIMKENPTLIPCIHLDYSKQAHRNLTFVPSHHIYPQITHYIKHVGGGYREGGGDIKIQFCKKYDSEVPCIFSCYDGSFDCYEPQLRSK